MHLVREPLPRPEKKKWIRRDWQQIVEDYADSEDADSVAKKHGMSRGYLKHRFRQFGITVPDKKRGRPKLPRIDLEWLHDLETELVEGRPEIALESIRGAIKIHEQVKN